MNIADITVLREKLSKTTQTELANQTQKKLRFKCYEYSIEGVEATDTEPNPGHLLIDGKYKVFAGEVRQWSSNGDFIDHNNEHDLEVVGNFRYLIFRTYLNTNC